MKPITLTFLRIAALICAYCAIAAPGSACRPAAATDTTVTVGAARTELYLPLLRGKRVGLFSNHTGLVGSEHTLDLMRRNGVDVRVIFSPEHGFRGTADAGSHVADSRDPNTGLPVESLYGSKSTPKAATMEGIDVIVCDIQDVGLRFYTYYITMIRLMEAAARSGKEFMVLDRPNPNGMTVDGPVLDMRHASGVGRLPLPVMHGLTLGELAQMAVGEEWVKGAYTMPLHVIPCEGYTHQTRYRLPVAPSPNLPDMKAIYLYGSTCYFEGTPISLGRGTDTPFTIYGHPALRGMDYTFTPRPRPGATNPPCSGRTCHGRNLRSLTDEQIIAAGVNLEYVIDAWRHSGMTEKEFFKPFFTLLTGTPRVQRMIVEGCSADEIRASWTAEVEAFRELRRPYLIYPE